MPEATRSYKRWTGPLTTRPLTSVVAENEVRLAFVSLWSRIVILLALLYTSVAVASLYRNRQNLGSDVVHSFDAFVGFLNNLQWVALAVAAIVGAPAILEDLRRGALELYLGRAVTSTHYLVGKIFATVGLTTLAVMIPALVYVGATAVLFRRHPIGWAWAVPGALLYALLLGLMVGGLALGLSAVSRSSRAATLVLFGGVAVLELVVRHVLEGITREPRLAILSPLAAFEQQSEWIFPRVTATSTFPLWWGIAEISVLIFAGWFLLWWRRPRVPGEDRGSP